MGDIAELYIEAQMNGMDEPDWDGMAEEENETFKPDGIRRTKKGIELIEIKMPKGKRQWKHNKFKK